ncbi:hypothetical protein IWW36_003184 [Coemansia brasiliensis]|uniref:Uncharacterized protein n=1 Tax=Coemansia brasiliensis TaxID=2650707 RepID=A0A9W8IC39_9FUNG|nr:hypothetical protein IWW36_003184 [Coemansia brasiliensis]
MRGIVAATAIGILIFAGISAAAGACENPASFKKCLAQTRAEVNICGINMTCKCLRQENVVRCYEKCGDDGYYKKLKLGEKGQQQIFCSQKRAGEPEDMPIIGSDGGPVEEKKEESRPKPKSAPPPPLPPPIRSDPDGGRRDSMDGASRMTGATLINNMDIDGAIPSALINTHLLFIAIVLLVLQ